MSDDLLDLVSAREGHFRLESGYHGALWLDLDPLFLSPARLEPYIEELVQLLSRHDVSAVCGPLVGGAFLAQSLAAALGIEFYYTERYLSSDPGNLYPYGYRLPASLCPVIRGKHVAIVDDVISAGSAVLGTLAAVESCGAVPTCIAAFLVLGGTAHAFCTARNIPLESLERRDYTLWAPEACPLCAAGVPLKSMANDQSSPS